MCTQCLCMSCWCLDPHFLDLGTRRRWVASFTPRLLYPQYSLDRRLGGPQSCFEHCGDKKILDPKGIWNDLSVNQPMGICYTNCTILPPWPQYAYLNKLLWFTFEKWGSKLADLSQSWAAGSWVFILHFPAISIPVFTSYFSCKTMGKWQYTYVEEWCLLGCYAMWLL
jgi:hypothetical protein